MVPVGWDHLGVLALQERVGREDDVGVSAFEELKGLADILAVDQFFRNELPDLGVLKGLLGG